MPARHFSARVQAISRRLPPAPEQGWGSLNRSRHMVTNPRSRCERLLETAYVGWLWSVASDRPQCFSTVLPQTGGSKRRPQSPNFAMTGFHDSESLPALETVQGRTIPEMETAVSIIRGANHESMQQMHTANLTDRGIDLPPQRSPIRQHLPEKQCDRHKALAKQSHFMHGGGTQKIRK